MMESEIADAREILDALSWQGNNSPALNLCTTPLRRECRMASGIGIKMREWYGHCPCTCHTDYVKVDDISSIELEDFIRRNWQ